MMESHEYLTTPMQPIQYKIKEDDPIEGNKEKGKQTNAKRRTKASVARMAAESIATKLETQPSSMPRFVYS